MSDISSARLNNGDRSYQPRLDRKLLEPFRRIEQLPGKCFARELLCCRWTNEGAAGSLCVPRGVDQCGLSWRFAVAQAWRDQGWMLLRGWPGRAVHFALSNTTATVIARLARHDRV